MKKMFEQAIEANKEAAKSAAMIKIGKTANDTVSKIVAKKLPKKYQKFGDHPLFSLAVSNVMASAMKNMLPNRNRKTDKVADSMLLASMIDLTNLIDISEITKEVLSKVDINLLKDED